MLKTITVAVFLCTSLLCYSQNYEKQFKDFAATNDTSGQAKVLSAWAAASPKDPELFIAYFNYYVRRSMREVVSLDKDHKDKNSIVLTDTGHAVWEDLYAWASRKLS